MDERVSLTIAIPTYNRCKSVIRLVEALVPQLGPDDELLVVDDGSQDETAASLRAIPQARLLRNSSNQGMVKTWNMCLTSASHDWICIVHDDDSIASNALETIRRACLIANGPTFIGHRIVGTDIDSCFRYQVWEPGPWAVLNSTFIPSGATIHRNVVDSLGVFDERFTYSSDIEYFARICARYKAVVIESPEILRYNQHDENYQYKTWREPDFLAQLEEIEKRVMAHAGLSNAAAANWMHQRWTNYIIYMFRCASRINNRYLLRKTGRMLWKRPEAGWRLRLRGLVAAVIGWCPR